MFLLFAGCRPISRDGSPTSEWLAIESRVNVAHYDLRFCFSKADRDHVGLELDFVFEIHFAVDVACDCFFHFVGCSVFVFASVVADDLD